jgi:hypothetical protein
MDERYKGVKGWLLLLCISLSVLDPAAIFFNLMYATDVLKSDFDKHPALFRLVLTGGLCSIGLIIFSVYAGISLWRTHPRAVTYAKRYLICASAYSLISLYLPRMMGMPDQEQQAISAVSSLNTLVTIAYMAAWYGYLMWSKRVAVTFKKG